MKQFCKFLTVIFLLANLNFIKAETTLDFDGDGKTDFGVIRNPNIGGTIYNDWYISRSSDGALFYTRFGFGTNYATIIPPGDTLTPADFDGDGRTDIAIWRPSSQAGMSAYYILNSSNGTLRIENFGQSTDDITAVGDYDGDGRADLAAYRKNLVSKVKNIFIYRGSLNNPSGNLTTVQLGSGNGVRRYPGDFDGDGKLDFCIRNTTTGVFTLKRSSDSGIETINWGLSSDYEVPGGDFDGDGRSDFCFVRPVGGQYQWHILERDGGGTGANPIIWGLATAPSWDGWFSGGDYDGDGKSDIGVVRYSGNQMNFLVRRSSNGSLLQYVWGISGDQPLVKWW